MAAQTANSAWRMQALGVAPLRNSIRLTSLSRKRRTRSALRALPLDGAALEQSLRHVATGDIGHQVLSALTTLADAELAQTVSDAAQTVSDTAASAGTAAVETAAKSTGPFTFIADGLESILKVIDSGLEAVHVPYSYGFSIIILTVLVKILTFPLSKQQVESSIAMQQLQPQIKEIQEKNKNNPQAAQQLTAQLYQSAGVNPLAGCLPTLATIPVFIGLYRALLNAADEGVLSDGFFVIPSLAGPTTIAARQAGTGLSWLFPFKDGAPPIGWHDAGAYLVLPVLLVISQYISQSILQPTRSADPAQGGAQTFLKVLPVLLGWFSLNVPSGLALYWITNNVLTTGQQLYLKRGVATPVAAKTTTAPTPAAPVMGDVIDAVATERKLTGQEMGARRSKKKKEEPEGEVQDAVPERKKKGERFRARKAREAARKAKSQSKRLRSKKKPFIPEQPDAEVVSAFEKELASSGMLPLTDDTKKEEVESPTGMLPLADDTKKEEVESKSSAGGGVPTHDSQ